ncbi:MAG: OmpH family outer membrane protein [Myxococcota bacterium]
MKGGIAMALGLALAIASAPALAEEVKIGIVDVEQALTSTEDGKAAFEEIKRKAREARAEVSPMMDQRKVLAEELQGKKYVLSDDALFQKQVQLAELENKIKSKLEELDGQLKIEQGKMLAPLETRMRTVIETIGKEKGFTLILQRNNPYLIYSREALDITDMVVARFNQKG